jgi:hypothetical protein
MKAKSIKVCFILLMSSLSTRAANRFWIAGAASNWNNTANWSNVSGGAGGFSVPVAGDNVTFDNGGAGDCTFDAAVSVATLTVSATYAGTISQGANTITTTGAVAVGGGSFTGGSANMVFGGAFTLSGTATFTATTALLEFQNNCAFTAGTFNHNNGSVQYNRAAGLTISGLAETFYNLEFVGNGAAITLTGGALSVSNTLTISGGSLLTLNTGTVNAQGDIVITNTATGGGGTALIDITGTGAQNFTGGMTAGFGALPQLTINKPSGTLNLLNFPSVANNFTYTSGTVNAGASTLCFTRAAVNYTLTGSLSLANMLFTAAANFTATIAAGTTITCTGNLTMAGNANITLNTGTIDVGGNLVLTNTGVAGGGSATIAMNGSGAQIIDGSAITGNENLLPILSINATGTISLLGNISLGNSLTYVSGSLNAGSSTVYAATSLTITGTFSLYNLTLNRGANQTVTIAAGSTVTATNLLDMENGAFNLTINTGTIAVQGNIVDNNTGLAGGGTGTILIDGTGAQVISTLGVIDQGSFPAVTLNNTSGSIQLPSLMTVLGNWTYIAGTLDVTTNNSTVVFGKTLTLSGTHSLNNVDFDAPANATFTFAAGTVLTINGTMSMTNTANITLTAGTIDLNGNLALSNTGVGGGGTTLLTFTGATNQSITGALAIDQNRLPAVTINKPGGTLTFNSLITVRGNWTYTAGTLDVTTNNSTVIFRNTLTISGTHTLNTVTFAANANYTYTFTNGTVLTVSGTLTTSGANTVTLNTAVAGTSVVNAQGAITINNTAAGGGGTAGILINGTGAQAFSSTAASGQGRMPYITIQKASGTLTLSGVISESRNWTYTSGTVDATTNTATVVFGGNNLSISSQGMSFYNVAVTGNTSTLANALTANNNMTITGGILAAGANTINVGGNWNDYGTAGFTEATSTVNFTGAGLQTITSPGGEDFANLAFNNSGAGIQLENNVTSATTLNLVSGNTDLNSNTLTLGLSAVAPGTLTYTAGNIINTGTFTRWLGTGTIAAGSVAGLFPMGTTTDNRPLSVSAPAAGPTTGGTISVSYTDAATNSSVSISDPPNTIVVQKNLNWTVSTGNGLAGGTYNLQVQGTSYGTIGSVSDLRLSLLNSVVGSAGANGGTTSDPQVNRTGLSLANLTNTFYLGSINGVSTPLPVTLAYFNAAVAGNKVQLDWETTVESNSAFFTIQRSGDGIGWADVVEVTAQGTSTSPTNYETTDDNPLQGVSFYRLEQTDRDGKISYSIIRTVTRTTAGNAEVLVYPNPATDHLTIVSRQGERVAFQLMDLRGHLIQASVSFPGNPAVLSLRGLAEGAYFLRIQSGEKVVTRTIVVKR